MNSYKHEKGDQMNIGWRVEQEYDIEPGGGPLLHIAARINGC